MLASTPPMGWNSWNTFRGNISATLLQQTAQAMATNGMKDAGYQYVIVDDDWLLATRDGNGNQVPDPNVFPSGVKPVADYIHSLGLKFGIYTDVGTKTCEGRAGSYGYELQDAAQYAAWGADYVKVDWCFTSGIYPQAEYGIFSNALLAAGRPMVFSICNWGVSNSWVWGPYTGNLWRTTPDIGDSWNSVVNITDSSSIHAAAAGPGHWNDPDMLEVGNGGMTTTEDQSHFSLWAMMAAPLIAGNDVRSMSAATISILTNREVIAIDQDPLGTQGVKVQENVSGLQVWARPVQTPGNRAVLLLNRNGFTQTITFTWSDVGLGPGAASVRDLWEHTEQGTYSSQYSASVPPSGSVMLLVRGHEPPPPTNVTYVSDMQWTYSAVSCQRDMDIAGQPVSLRGQHYAKGVGCLPTSEVRVHLGGGASKFISDIGINDDVYSALGYAIFEVWADGARLFRSNTLTVTSAIQSVTLDVTGKQDLRLRVVPDLAHDENNAYAVWAGARIVGANSTPNDGVPDWWRQQYFGTNSIPTNAQSCAWCDADGTGQNNLFKYTAGLDPTNPASVFTLRAAIVTNQPTALNLIYGPVVSNRTYAIQSSVIPAGGTYSNLVGFTGPTTNAAQIMITDPATLQSNRFYHLQISWP